VKHYENYGAVVTLFIELGQMNALSFQSEVPWDGSSALPKVANGLMLDFSGLGITTVFNVHIPTAKLYAAVGVLFAWILLLKARSKFKHFPTLNLILSYNLPTVLAGPCYMLVTQACFSWIACYSPGKVVQRPTRDPLRFINSSAPYLWHDPGKFFVNCRNQWSCVTTDFFWCVVEITCWTPEHLPFALIGLIGVGVYTPVAVLSFGMAQVVFPRERLDVQFAPMVLMLGNFIRGMMAYASVFFAWNQWIFISCGAVGNLLLLGLMLRYHACSLRSVEFIKTAIYTSAVWCAGCAMVTTMYPGLPGGIVLLYCGWAVIWLLCWILYHRGLSAVNSRDSVSSLFTKCTFVKLHKHDSASIKRHLEQSGVANWEEIREDMSKLGLDSSSKYVVFRRLYLAGLVDLQKFIEGCQQCEEGSWAGERNKLVKLVEGLVDMELSQNMPDFGSSFEVAQTFDMLQRLRGKPAGKLNRSVRVAGTVMQQALVLQATSGANQSSQNLSGGGLRGAIAAGGGEIGKQTVKGGLDLGQQGAGHVKKAVRGGGEIGKQIVKGGFDLGRQGAEQMKKGVRGGGQLGKQIVKGGLDLGQLGAEHVKKGAKAGGEIGMGILKAGIGRGQANGIALEKSKMSEREQLIFDRLVELQFVDQERVLLFLLFHGKLQEEANQAGRINSGDPRSVLHDLDHSDVLEWLWKGEKNEFELLFNELSEQAASEALAELSELSEQAAGRKFSPPIRMVLKADAMADAMRPKSVASRR
jgi:hypothetical protein